MAKSYEEVITIRDRLRNDYQDRHEAHRRLRKFWHGRYWENSEVDTHGINSIFGNVTARTSDIGPDIKLTYNLLKDVCVKFQTYLAPVPMIRCYVDPPASTTRRNQATLKERYLYGLWSLNNMNKVLADQGWFLPLMGDAYLGIYPDLDKNLCRTLLRSPEYAHPLMNYDDSGEDGVIFSWKTKRSSVERSFPNWTPNVSVSVPQATKDRFTLSSNTKPKPSDPLVEIVEYSDDFEFDRWVDGVRVTGVEHNFGFNLFDHVKFINVPGEVWGHGAVEQAVNLTQMSNAYLSLMMQSAIENVFPVMVLEDPMKAPETIERGAGAVIPVNAGGKVYYLTPPAGDMMAQAEWGQNVERMIKTDTSMPDVNFGQAQNSIITGKAINELQGAGTGTLVDMVQGVGIGAALVSWNEKAIQMGRTMFKDDQISLYGTETASLGSLNPRHFALNLKGSQLVGSTRNEVVFMPYLDMQQKVVIGLQLAGAGLVSRKWQQENVGIPDSEAMDEEIVSEAIQDAVLKLIVTSITDPESAHAAEGQADSYIEGGSNPHPLTTMQPPAVPPGVPGAPPPGGPPAAGPGGGGPAFGGQPGGTGQTVAPPLPLPPGAPAPGAPPGGLAPGAAPPSHGTTQGQYKLDQVIQQFQAIQGLAGRVFLVGEIVQTGSTSDTINVDITSSSDRDVISRQVQLPMQIKVVSKEPSEPYIEVTPGVNPVQKGELPQPEEALS